MGPQLAYEPWLPVLPWLPVDPWLPALPFEPWLARAARRMAIRWNKPGPREP